jgi:hypothetical protein
MDFLDTVKIIVKKVGEYQEFENADDFRVRILSSNRSDSLVIQAWQSENGRRISVTHYHGEQAETHTTITPMGTPIQLIIRGVVVPCKNTEQRRLAVRLLKEWAPSLHRFIQPARELEKEQKRKKDMRRLPLWENMLRVF